MHHPGGAALPEPLLWAADITSSSYQESYRKDGVREMVCGHKQNYSSIRVVLLIASPTCSETDLQSFLLCDWIGWYPRRVMDLELHCDDFVFLFIYFSCVYYSLVWFMFIEKMRKIILKSSLYQTEHNISSMLTLYNSRNKIWQNLVFIEIVMKIRIPPLKQELWEGSSRIGMKLSSKL